MIETLNSLGITNGMITSAGITIVISLIAVIGGKRIETVPNSKLQGALELAVDTMHKAVAALDEAGLSNIHICPETMGKVNQLGTLYEVLELCKVDERLIPCIDFGHLNARDQGSLKTKADFEEIFLAIKNTLGSDRLKSFHSHFSKIEYTAGGEKRHLTFDDTVYGPEYEPVMELTYKYGCDPVFICESAGTQAEDARQMKDYYNSIRGEKQ